MPRLDWDVEDIEIYSFTDFWGPHKFEFEPILPSGLSIYSVTVKSYDVDDVETSSYLVEPGEVSISGSDILIKLQYPGDAYVGRHRLVFEITFNTGAKHSFWFGYVIVAKTV